MTDKCTNIYADLDERICMHLKQGGIHPTRSRYLVAFAAKTLTDQCKQDFPDGALRLIDRRLQALRKEGKIIYVRGVRPHWELRSGVEA